MARFSLTIRYIFALVRSHLDLFVNGFDFVKSDSASSSGTQHCSCCKPLQMNQLLVQLDRVFCRGQSKLNHHFAVPLAIITLTTVQGLFGLDQPIGQVDFRSDSFVTHRIFPRQVWAQSDLIMCISVVMSFTIYAQLMLHPLLDGKHCM